MDILGKIKKIAEEIGFDLIGVAEIALSLAMTNENDKLDKWVENGYCADMKWFADMVEKRKDILKVMPDAKSVICVGMNYYCDGNMSKEESVGKIARYASGRDYHKIFDKKLKLFAQRLKDIFPEGEFKYYCDTGPVLERAWAVKAGLGFVGKNTNLITKYGSWVLLGEIITNAEFGLSHEKTLDFSQREKSALSFRPRSSAVADTMPAHPQMFFLETTQTPQNHREGCGSCRRCLDACPTGALVAPYTVDARRCISYLTIEHKGEIPIELREKMDNRIFGCDACQEVCPFNIGRFVFAKASADKAKSELIQSVIVGEKIDLKEILSIKNDEEFLKKFAGSPLMRAKRRGLVRNACIAAGNSSDKSLQPYLKECLNDKELVISETAKWAIEEIEKMVK